MHDHHSYHYGKDSHLYKETLKAINNSKISLMPAKYLNGYFGNPKCIYFSHGVNTDFYTPSFSEKFEDKKCFLMLANNGLAGDKSYDRKGFEFGIALANMTGEYITVAGPSNNQHFFNSNLSRINVLGVHQHQNFLFENQEPLELRLLLPQGKCLYK